MALNKQIYIYSVDTSAFFTAKEQEVANEKSACDFRKKMLKREQQLIDDTFLHPEKSEKIFKKVQDLHKEDENFQPKLSQERISEITCEIAKINQLLRAKKQELEDLFRLHSGVRELRTDTLIQRNTIAVFESVLTRTLSMKQNELYEDLIVLETYYFPVFEDLVRDGFTLRVEKYICFTASAGQIRTKKTVFIKERLWKQHQLTLMCGLTTDCINAKGGININKYLAYLALCDSATDEWTDFDIDRSIVVDDFDTLVHGTVDFVDHHTYTIERKEMDVPICHTDGCGIMLPCVSRKNFMIRPPWIKGLLAVFPFHRFIREKNGNPKVRDIYGKEYDIFEDQIEVIFTKSQFKMWNYYESWDDYKAKYKKHHCTTGICNVESDQIENAKLNYQMLQTLPDLSDEELTAICRTTNQKLQNLCSDRATMLRVFRATPQNKRKGNFETALMLYPELLQDAYSRKALGERKKSIERDAWSGKVDIDGKYTFIIPDLYAFCERLFLGVENPAGLLDNGEVFCKLYADTQKLDCLRNPHLYMEHAVRKNVLGGERRHWFVTKGCYTSCHDLISKILQFDVDGDTSLVCADETIIRAAERNGEDVVPLYYKMAKAEAKPISRDAIFRGMRAAYTGGNIGVISNDISKIWNSEKPDKNLVKLLCCENNFVIDYAKTLYKPVRPKEISRQLKEVHNEKVPRFFLYAKDKMPEQVAPITESPVNRMQKIVPKRRLKFVSKQLGKFDYRMLMCNPDTRTDHEHARQITGAYHTLTKNNVYVRRNNKEEKESNNYGLLLKKISETLQELCPDRVLLTDILVKHLFFDSQSQNKVTFWACCGDIVIDNLLRNLKSGEILCQTCGIRFLKESPNQKYCKDCQKPKEEKTIICADCGRAITTTTKNNRAIRCPPCQRREQNRKRKMARIKANLTFPKKP